MEKRYLKTALNNEAADREMLQSAINIQLPSDGKAPEWTELIPSGRIVHGRDGREWLNDSPQGVVDAFAANKAPIPIDIEHASERKAPVGDPAPAMAWVEEMKVREDGSIWGRVDWTPKGLAMVANREYRFLSPVILYEKDTRRIRAISSVGLTNKHNLFLHALNSEQNHKEDHMDLKQLLAALGLPETGTFAEALNAIGKLKGDLATATNRAENPSLEKFVPRGDYSQALARAENAEKALKEVKDGQLEKDINTEIEAALKAGKITPSTAEYHKAQCRQEGGLDRFREYVKAAPAIADESELGKKHPGGQDKALNSEEKDIAAALGVSAEDFSKAKA